MIIAILLIVWYYDQPSLWLNFYDKIPGGIGIRAVGRVVLFLLIPAVLGLAMLVQFLEHRQWTMAASILVLVCILEQGVTTESVDAAEGRANVASLVRQVDPRQEAFYYRPGPNPARFIYQLDAMWASLATGVPTINGYSGYHPPGWEGFFAVDAISTLDPRKILAAWEQTQGLAPSGFRASDWIKIAPAGDGLNSDWRRAAWQNEPRGVRSGFRRPIALDPDILAAPLRTHP